MANEKNSIISNSSEIDNLKNVTIRKVKGFTLIENNNPIKLKKEEGGPNDPVVP